MTDEELVKDLRYRAKLFLQPNQDIEEYVFWQAAARLEVLSRRVKELEDLLKLYNGPDALEPLE